MKGKSPLFGKTKRPKLPSGMSRSQKRRIERGYRKIDDHLTDKDISGAINEINGKPVTRKNGVPFQHVKEVEDAIRGLTRDRDSLKKSIKNPNMQPEIKSTIKTVIKDFDVPINKWDKIKRGN